MSHDLDDEEYEATRKMFNKDEIGIGEYVRTNKGNIGKVINIFPGHTLAKYHIEFQGNVKVKRQYLSTKTIINHSPNIIDLIEEGDYVNGSRVDSIEFKENGFITTEFCEKISVTRLNYEIKSIATKEQFKKTEYIVEE